MSSTSLCLRWWNVDPRRLVANAGCGKLRPSSSQSAGLNLAHSQVLCAETWMMDFGDARVADSPVLVLSFASKCRCGKKKRSRWALETLALFILTYATGISWALIIFWQDLLDLSCLDGIKRNYFEILQWDFKGLRLPKPRSPHEWLPTLSPLLNAI